MKCKHCGSENMVVFTKKTGIRNSLYCGDCLSFQKFLIKEEQKFFDFESNKIKK